MEAQKGSSKCAKSAAKIASAIDANKEQIQKSYVISEHIRAWKRRCEAKELYDAAVAALEAAKEKETQFRTPLRELEKKLSKKRRESMKIIASTASTEGAVKERTRQLQLQQLELRETKELKHIGKRHKRKLIECETQKFAIADLEKCVASSSSLLLSCSLVLWFSCSLVLPCVSLPLPLPLLFSVTLSLCLSSSPLSTALSTLRMLMSRRLGEPPRPPPALTPPRASFAYLVASAPTPSFSCADTTVR